jgi:AAHS family 3-hydroxyphenylpropionic acid transporter
MQSAQADASESAGWLTVFLCFLVATFEGIDLQAAGVVVPKIIALFQLAEIKSTFSVLGAPIIINGITLFVTASTIGLILGAIIGGRIADRIGRKNVLMLSMAIFGAFSVATAHAYDFNSLTGFRFLTGLGLGGALPNLIALASENAGDARRKLAVALMYCGMPFGGGLASFVVAFGIGGQDWKDVFYAGGLAPLIAIPLLWLFLPESRQFQSETAALGANTPRQGYFHALFGEGRAAATLAIWISFFFALLVLYLLLNWLPQLQDMRGLSKRDGALVQAGFNFGGAAGAVVAGALMDGRLARPMMILTYTATALGLVFLAYSPATLSAALLAGVLVGAGIIGVQGILYSLAPVFYPTLVRGTGVGAAVSAGRVGSVTGPVVAGVLLSSGLAPADLLLRLLPAVGISFLAGLYLVLKMPTQKGEKSAKTRTALA